MRRVTANPPKMLMDTSRIATNAISGIIITGALLQIGHHDLTITVLAFIAILLVSINIFGGFAVTRRMLGMFSK